MNDNQLIRIDIPPGAAHIIRVLREHGYEGFAVGGCVRDVLLGRVPSDWDITTSARPEQVKALFRRTVDTGIAHGTVTVLTDGDAFEVTTYRIDGEYEDARHPKRVTFTPALADDLERRDCTINAMAYSPEKGLVDLFDGIGDLKRGVVRCVGDAGERFSEDALRIMRAVRFAAQLGFSLDPDTRLAAARMAQTLTKISAERVRDELVKLICSDRPGMIDTARQCGITGVVLPEFDRLFAVPLTGSTAEGKDKETAGEDMRWSTGSQAEAAGSRNEEEAGKGPGMCPENAGVHTLQTMENIREADPEKRRLLRLTMLLHDIGKSEIRPIIRETLPDGKSRETGRSSGTELAYPGHARLSAAMAETVLRRLKADNATIRTVTTLIRYHTDLPDRGAAQVRHLMRDVGKDLFPLWLQVKEADILAGSPLRRAEKLEKLHRIQAIYRQAVNDGDPIGISDLAVTGTDLIADGMKPGKEMGSVLAALLEEVLEEPSRNTKAYLIERSRSLRKA